MKLTDILKELDKPEKIYADDFEEDDISDLTMQQKKDLFKKGSLLIPINDPSKPGVTSASKVIYTTNFDKLKVNLVQNKKEISKYKYHPNTNIKELAEKIIVVYNKMYTAIDKLENLVKLENEKK